MNIWSQRLSALSGVAMIVLMLVGMQFFAGFIPPPAPWLNADEIAHIYASNTNGIRFGMLLVTFGAVFLAPFIVMITVQMKRIEGARTPLAYVQFALGTLFVIEFIIPSFVCIAATYRPERSPEITQALNDLCWLMFVGVVSTAVVELMVIAAAIFSDRSEDPVFPRWAGWFNVWAGLVFCPGGAIMFFKYGPLAWNGLLTWWIPLSMFGVWLAVMAWLLLRAIDRDPANFPDDSEIVPV